MLGLTLGGLFTALGAVVWFKVLVPLDRMLQMANEMRSNETFDRGWIEGTPKATEESLTRLREALARGDSSVQSDTANTKSISAPLPTSR
jgi:hypothetical protein